MICQKCGHENKDEFNFCEKCANPLKANESFTQINITQSIPKSGMKCPRCGSANINVVMDTSQKIKNMGCLWGLGRGLLILCTVGLWLLVPKRIGSTKSKPTALCQNCGNKFRV